ncbi:hypothetical protein B4N89_41495 [Embleya scabrispora]|uniref:Chaplin domain-containing protein n=1 Tax=Embleya scabrispora TaxID=159449 RepID=A0A1T3NK19_9ACTN|nr:hypothetical protein B4N89_41495 [Embleya scabrispora]
MPQRANRLSVPVVALLFVLSLVSAFAAGFGRGEGAGGSLPVAAATVHATPVSGGPHGLERPQDCRPASSTSAPVATAGELDRPDPHTHVDAAGIATDERIPRVRCAPPVAGSGIDPLAGYGPRPPPARGPPERPGT